MRRPRNTHVMVSFGVSVTVRSLRGRAVTYLVLTESSIMPDTYVRMYIQGRHPVDGRKK